MNEQPSTPTPAGATDRPGTDLPAHRYTAALADEIELRWQDRWQESGAFHAADPAGSLADPQGVQAYPGGHQVILDMFPYPSGVGLHVGHPLGYIATDVTARYQRMLGKNVLHALGYDAFGLPAEQYAVQTGQHPRITTEENMAVMRRQLRRMGLGLDDRRSISTIDPDYYKWTQWIFLQIWNAWYDTQAPRPDGGGGRARPISELVEELSAGTRALDGDFAQREWSQLSPRERSDYLDTQRLAYTSHAPVNWAPGLGTVLSNEEVTADGRSERGNFPVFKTNLQQWMMRITSYADRLEADLDRIEWPDKVKAMQRNWIGRSTGATVRFAVEGSAESIAVFTTRPDTIFGATFMVLAPEHPLLDADSPLIPQAWPSDIPADALTAWTGGAENPLEALEQYRRAASRKSDVERQKEDKTKTGVFTGLYAINPASGTRIPVFTADYVLVGYGTGAIMAVPAQDDRDWDFAKALKLPIIRTVQPPADHPEDEPYLGVGAVINSAHDGLDINGLEVEAAKQAVVDHLSAQGVAEATVTYRLRDWLFSRQRYWGEPFPIVYDTDGVAHGIPTDQLPVELPDVPDYSPTVFDPEDTSASPEAPLGRAHEWVNVTLDLGDGPREYRRETNTMPNWAGSCWYYLRYLDPANGAAFVAPENEQYWMGPRDKSVAGAAPGSADPGGIDLYVGGVEHAVLHLLYARFWHKVLHDLGYLSSSEPFRTYFSQGYIQAAAYRDDRGQPVPAAEVEESLGADGVARYTWHGQQVTREFGKIGKSLKNSISPDEMYAQYGADTFRVYEMSMGPLELSKPWETRAVVGAQRFLQRVWRNVIDEDSGALRVVDAPATGEIERIMHVTIDAVRRDYSTLGFNTAIARLIEFNNALTKADAVPREAAETLVLMLAPLAPHIAEELWQRLGHQESLVHHDFPVADASKLVADTVTCVVQISGKVRDRLEVPADIAAADLEALALASTKVAAYTENGIRKVIVREPKLVNIVPA